MIAFADESCRETPGGLLYVVASAVVVREDLERARTEVAKLLHPGTDRFHWRDEREDRRMAMLERIAELDVLAMAVAYYPTAPRRQERARAASLLELARDLRREGVGELVLESRQEILDRNDRRTLIDARHVGITDEAFRYRHARPKEEPMLWVADAVAAAVSMHVSEATSRYFERLRPNLLQIRRIGGR